MVEFRDGTSNSKTARQNDGGLGGQVFRDAKRDRQDNKDKERDNPKPHVQPQDGGRRPHPDFTPPVPSVKIPQRDHTPRIQPTDTTPKVPQPDRTPRVNPRDQFPNFPNIPAPKTDQHRPRPEQKINPDTPKPGPNVTPRVEFPDFKPQPRINPDVKPTVPNDRNRPGVTPAFPFNTGDNNPTVKPEKVRPGVTPSFPFNTGDNNPTVKPDKVRPGVSPSFPFNTGDNNPAVNPQNPNIRPDGRPATPSPYDFRPNERQDGKPRIPRVAPRTDVPAVQPGVNPVVVPPADGPRINPGRVQPRTDVPAVQPGVNPVLVPPAEGQRINPGRVQPRTDVPQPGANGPRFDNSQPQFRPQKPNIVNNIVTDLLIGPQAGPGYYPGGGYNPGFYPQRPNTPGAILNDVVNDLINPGYNPNNYDPRFDPRLDPHNPNYDARMDVNNPNYDARFDPRLDPRSPSYDPRMDNRNPNYDPRIDPRNPNYDARLDPTNNPRYNPRHNPNFPPTPNAVGRRIVNDVIGDLLGPSGPGCNPGGYYPQPDCGPGGYPQGYNFPQRYQPGYQPGGRFAPNGPVRDFIRQGLGNLRNNPQALDGLMNGLGGLLGDAQFNIDRERGELNLAMDFTRAYDSITQKQGTPPNEEIRRVLGELDSINLSADAMNLNWKGEQLIALGDKANGPGKDLRILLGGGTNRTSFEIQSNETRLNLSNIQGLEAVDPQGRRLRVHMIDLDTSDPAGPKGSITIDNPMPKPAQLPANVQWPEQVALPIPMNGPEQKQMADALPGMIRTVNSMRNAAKSGDLSQLMGNLNPGDLANIIGMLKGPRPQPVNPDQYRPDVPPPPQPGIRSDGELVPPPPEPGIPSDRVIPAPPEPGIPGRVNPTPEVAPGADLRIKPLGNADYLDFAPAPSVTPQAEVKPAELPVAPPPAAVDVTPPPPPPPAAFNTTAKPVAPPAGSAIIGRSSMLRGNPTASLFARSLGRETTPPPAVETSVVPDAAPKAPAAEITSDSQIIPAELPPAPKPVEPVTPLPVAEKVEPVTPVVPKPVEPVIPTPVAEKPLEPVTPAPVAPQAEVRPQPITPPRGSADFLRANGIKIPESQKIGPEKLFDMVFADADQTGPLVTGFNRALSETRFRQDVSTIGSTLNRFDVDKTNRAITVGLDFAQAYDTIETDRTKYKPETRQFLSGLQTVTITPEQISLKLNGPSKLPMDGEGLKKADLWLGTANGETTFTYQTTEKGITLQAKGLQAEVAALGKKLNVHEITIDTSTGTATATALIDNPFDKPPGVPESTWSKTMAIPIDLGKTPEETAEVNKRLPQTLKSLHAMQQGAKSGAMAERMGNLTKEDIIALLKFQ